MTQASLVLTTGLAALTALTTAQSAKAQRAGTVMCAERDQIVGQLTDGFGESVRSIGLAGQNRIVEVYASDETGSWTITITSANGVTCLIAAGLHYESFAPALPGEPL